MIKIIIMMKYVKKISKLNNYIVFLNKKTKSISFKGKTILN